MTADGWQGQQMGIIAFSCVRSVGEDGNRGPIGEAGDDPEMADFQAASGYAQDALTHKSVVCEVDCVERLDGSEASAGDRG